VASPMRATTHDIVVMLSGGIAVSHDDGATFSSPKPLPAIGHLSASFHALTSRAEGLMVAITAVTAKPDFLLDSPDGGENFALLRPAGIDNAEIVSLLGLPDGRLLAGVKSASVDMPLGIRCSRDNGLHWLSTCQ
jgi:hypothetical protein